MILLKNLDMALCGEKRRREVVVVSNDGFSPFGLSVKLQLQLRDCRIFHPKLGDSQTTRVTLYPELTLTVLNVFFKTCNEKVKKGGFLLLVVGRRTPMRRAFKAAFRIISPFSIPTNYTTSNLRKLSV